MKNFRPLYFLLGLVVLLSLVLSACAPATPAQIEPGSILICPKHFEPGVSQCREKQNSTGEGVSTPEMNSLTEQEYSAVLLQSDQIAVYKKDSETYGLYKGAGYHPVPTDYAYKYHDTMITIMADIDPGACGGAYNETTCLKPKDGIVLKGQVKFDSSYTINTKLNVANQANLKLFYDAGGEDKLLKEFNERSRDVFQSSGDLDPQAWLDLTLTKETVAQNWRSKLINNTHMTGWKYYSLFDFQNTELVVRYFEPMKIEAGSDAQSEAIKKNTEYDEFLARREKFCGEFTLGSDARNVCFRTFVCYETGCQVLVENAMRFIPLSEFIPQPEATETPVP